MSFGIEYNPDSETMLGYSDAARLVSKHKSFGAAWNSLDVMSHEDAKEFLADKIKWLLHLHKAQEAKESATLEVILMFALVAIMADRKARDS